MRVAWLGFAVGLLLAVDAGAQGLIGVDDDATFERFVGSYDDHPEAELVASSFLGGHLEYTNEAGWWYRVAADTEETPIGAPDEESYGSSSSVATWDDVAARGLFAAEERVAIARLSPTGVILGMRLTVTNLSDGTLSLSVFHTLEPYLRSNSLDDHARLAGTDPESLVRVTDTEGEDFLTYLPRGDVDASWAVGSAVDTSGPAGRLRDDDVDDYANTGLPYVPTSVADNFSAGFQFVVSLAPGAASELGVRIGVNLQLGCGVEDGLFCDGFEIGSTAIWSPVAL